MKASTLQVVSAFHLFSRERGVVVLASLNREKNAEKLPGLNVFILNLFVQLNGL